MIHYTPLIIDDLWKHDQEIKLEQWELEHEGNIVVLEKLNNNQAKVVRLISSNSMAYLDQRYSPGRVIDMELKF